MPKVSDDYLAARRQQILDAAATCFARDGFHRTSMQDIVRESGISAGLVYRYFTGKDDIISAIVRQWHDLRAQRLEAATDHNGLVAAYLDVLRSVGDPQTRPDLRLGVQAWAEAMRSPHIRELVRDGVDGPRAAAAAFIRRTPSWPADLDPDAVARVFIAIYQGLALQTVLDDDIDHDSFVRTVAATVTALTAGSSRRAEPTESR
jgi:AcrR family transcriptional regulator